MSDTPEIHNIRESDGSIVTVEEHKSLPSTSALARKYAEEGKPDRYVVFSEYCEGQDGARERGVFMSVLLRPSFFPSQAPLLGCMSAISAVIALEEHTTDKLGVGWVSDVYCNGVRIGSSTIEGKLNSYTAYEYLIITYRIKLGKKNFPPRLTDLIVEVFQSGNSSLSMIIAKNILSKFFRFYSDLKGSAKYMDPYSSRFILRGVKVKYDYQGKKRSCKVLGVDLKTGSLVVDLGGGQTNHRITSPSLVTIPRKIKIKKDKKA